ncbi:MAG: translation initiation factor eIF-2B [Planctomycetota bacterium]
MSDPVRAIRNDVLSGASELLVSGARVLRRHARDSKARSRTSFSASLAKAGLAVADAQPAMAPFIHLANTALKAADSGDDLQSAKKAVVEAIDGFVEDAAEERHRSASLAADLIRNGSVVLVYSRSSTVESALLAARDRGRRFTVLCPEARPNMEGRILANRLAEAGIPVTAFVDAAAFSLFHTADLVMVGADAIVPVGLINKVGTSGLALLASQDDVPVYCIAGRTKMLPSAALIDPHREGEHLAEVWGNCPDGVRVMDRYYDLTQLDAVTGYVMEDRVVTTRTLRSRLRSIDLHERLQPTRRTPRKRGGRSKKK